MDSTLLQAQNPRTPLEISACTQDRGYFTTWRFLLFPLAVGLGFAIGLGCNTIRRRCSGESGYDMEFTVNLQTDAPEVKGILISLAVSDACCWLVLTIRGWV